MRRNNRYQHLLHDVIAELLTMTADAKTEANRTGDDFDKGRHFALYEVLSLVSQQVDAFSIPRGTLSLEGVDINSYLLSDPGDKSSTK